MNEARPVWLLFGGNIGPMRLGPAQRTWEIALRAAREGHPVHLVLDSWDVEPPAGIDIERLHSGVLDKIRHGDAVIVSPYIRGRILWRLMRRPIPFHLDFYCVTAAEILEMLPDWPRRERWIQRFRRRVRYATLLERAETVYLSNAHQTAFLGGLLFPSPDPSQATLAARLPSKVQEAPMGCREETFPTGAENPYPTSIHGRPVFLWGGGIWRWFDIETLLQAFVQLQAKGSPAVLFFLAGSNPTKESVHDGPVRAAIGRARELGVLGKSVHFNQRAAGPSQLPAYLEHCAAGVMANPASMEALCSWRTRLLDLAWAGRPVVTSGYDPLSGIFSRFDAGILTTVGDPGALAEAIDGLASAQDRRRELGENAALLGRKMSWSRTLAPLVEGLSSEGAFRKTGAPPSFYWLLRYAVGR